MRVDLHVHSKYSKRPATWLLKKLGCAESYTEPTEIRRLALERGMGLTTITDHNSIEGCLEIADLPATFMGVELTTYFPDDRCKIHILAYCFSEAQYREMDCLRENIFDLLSYLIAEGIPHALAHPMHTVNERMTIEHFEKCLLLFRYFELNGDQDAYVNEPLRRILGSLTPEMIERLANLHDLHPTHDAPWLKGLVSGSDDHSSLNIAHAYTEVDGAEDTESFWRGVESLSARPGFHRPSTPMTMAHNLYGVAYQMYEDKFKVSRYHDKSTMMRFLDRMLQAGERQEPRMIYRFYSRWRRNRSAPAYDSSIMARIQYEAEKIVDGDPQLAAVLKQGLAASREPERQWFRFVDQITNNMLRHLAQHTALRLQRKNPFDFFHTAGSAGALYSLLAPYFAAYSIYCRDRRFCENAVRALEGRREPRHPAVGHFTDTLEDVNGVAKTLQQQSENAHRTGKDLTMICCTTRDQESMLHAPGLRWFRPVETLRLPEYDELGVFIPPPLEMLQYAYERNFTHIHAATPGPIGLAGLGIARIMKIPFFTTYHTAFPQYVGALTDDPGIEDLAWRGMLWFYRQADIVFSPSQATADELIAKGVPAEKIRIQPRGVDAERFHPSKRRDNIGLPEGLRFLYVGRISKEKNLPTLVEAFRLLIQQSGNANPNLIIVGEGPWLEEMQAATQDLPCSYLGRLEGEDLTSVYASCDAFIFPSTTDTFGNVVLEAQASGLPIIVSNQGGPRENMIEERTGWIVPGRDAPALADAMLRLVNDPERLRRMGREARRYAEQRTFQKAFEAYWNFYETEVATGERLAVMEDPGRAFFSAWTATG